MTTPCEPTALERVEQERIDHTTKAIQESLAAQGQPPMDHHVATALARAALVAADRFPTEGWPFNVPLNDPPAGFSRHAYASIEEIDAGMWSGDAFHATQNHLFLAAYVQRWSKELRLRREEDHWNRLTDEEDEQD